MAYPTPPVPSMEPADFSAPSFGGIAPMPAPVPAPMAAPAPIVTPPSLPPGPMAPMGAPRFPQAAPPKEDLASTIVTLIPALLGGLKDPKLIGAAMRGIQKGRDEKFARQEHIQQTAERRQKDAADFYGRAIEQSQTIDDPADFERWRTMIGPTAQLYGIDPRTFTFNATKAQKKQQASLVAQLDAMEKRDPSLVSREDFKIVTPEYPQGVDVATVRTWRGQATDNSGKAILAAPKPDALTPNTPEEQFYAQYAKEHGAKTFAELPTTEQTKARQTWQQTNGAGVPNVGTFEDYLGRYAKEHGVKPDALTTAQVEDARKRYQQADDKPTQGNGAGEYREFLMADKLGKEWQTASQASREMNRQFGLMQTGLKRFREGDKNGGAQSVLVTFQKILDPSSVVRESEYARSAQGVSLLSRLEGYADRLRAGGAGVPDADLAQMVETAREFLGQMKTFTAGQRARLTRMAKQYNIAPELVFDDVSVQPDAPTTPTTPAAPVTSPTETSQQRAKRLYDQLVK